MKRLYNLDYLRGLAAFGIMIYHYLSWTLGKFTADTFMGRLGIYGVSIFYILSGLTLFCVYNDKMTLSKKDVATFFKKRVFSIFPLLWIFQTNFKTTPCYTQAFDIIRCGKLFYLPTSSNSI